jgi:hypothetical protein
MRLVSSRPMVVAVVVLLIVTAAAYLPGTNQFFVADGFQFIYAHLRTPAARFAISNWLGQRGEGGHYRPLFNLALSWLPRVFGLNPIPYHLFVYLWHLLACFCLYRLSYRLTSSALASALSVCLFAAHALNVWAVVWVHSGGPIFGFFYLLCLLLLVTPEGTGHSALRRVLTGSIALLALLAREDAVTLPVVGWIVVWCWKEGSAKRRAWQAFGLVWPTALAVLVYVSLRLSALGTLGGYVGGGRLGPAFGAEGIARYVEQMAVLWAPGGLVWPRLSWGNPGWWNGVFSAAALAPIVGFLILSLARLSPRRRVLALGMLAWTVVAPSFTFGMPTAPWRLYSAGLGWALFLAVILSGSRDRSRTPTTLTYLSCAGIGLYWLLHLSAFSAQLHAFEQASAITKRILEETVQLVPAPSENEVLCFEGVPDYVPAGAPVFAVGFQEAVRLAYGNDAIRACLAHQASEHELKGATHWFQFREGHLELAWEKRTREERTRGQTLRR